LTASGEKPKSSADVVSYAFPAGRLCAALPSHDGPPAAFRRAVAQAWWVPPASAGKNGVYIGLPVNAAREMGCAR
jgi:hypothetical protein